MAQRGSRSGLIQAMAFAIAAWSFVPVVWAADGDLDTTFGTPPFATGIVPIPVDWRWSEAAP